MVQTIKLGGKDRPILFGMTVFRLAKRQTGKSVAQILQELGAGGLDLIPDLVYCALRAGETAQRLQPDEFTPDEVSIWMDTAPDGMTQVLQQLFESLPKAGTGEDVEPGEAKIETGTLTN